MKGSILRLGLAGLVIVALMMAGRASSSGVNATEEKPATEIKIDNFSFSPSAITVAVGSTVRWTNHDDVPHNVVNDDKSIKSKTMDTDENFSYTFTKPGTYSYFCSIHPKMTGKVVVQ
jgi:amicyanin